MTINWFGLSIFKIQHKDTLILIDPPQNLYRKEKADLFLLSASLPSDLKEKIAKSDSWIVASPGEYEMKNTNLVVGSALVSGQKPNNIFFIELGGLKILHLGALKQKKSLGKFLEKIGDIDILIIPVGGHIVLGASEAAELVNEIEPAIVIPMFYKTQKTPPDSKLEGAEPFLKEIGQETQEMESLKIEKKTTSQEKTKVILLKPQSI